LELALQLVLVTSYYALFLVSLRKTPSILVWAVAIVLPLVLINLVETPSIESLLLLGCYYFSVYMSARICVSRGRHGQDLSSEDPDRNDEKR
jgi:hypothetical protein